MTNAATLHALHRNPDILLCGNAWDVGTARLIAHLGFPAIETSSAGLAFATGRPDAEGLITRTEMLESLGRIAAHERHTEMPRAGGQALIDASDQPRGGCGRSAQ